MRVCIINGLFVTKNPKECKNKHRKMKFDLSRTNIQCRKLLINTFECNSQSRKLEEYHLPNSKGENKAQKLKKGQ
jgi:hypothetical protein